MKKITYLIISLIMFVPISVFAVSSNEVDYEIDDYIVDSSIDISGNLKVREIIGVRGTFNGYIRDIVYKNNSLDTFTGKDSDFEGSSIYNASNVEIINVGSISWNGELDFDAFSKEVNYFSMCSNKKNCYEKNNINNGISLKMYNETEDDITYFYIEYTLGNVVVMHEDVAEIYYNFIGENFDDDINRYNLRVLLPSSTNELVRVWAHGPLHGEVNPLKKDEIYYGGILSINDLYSNTPVDLRMTFPKDLISVLHPYLKKSNVEALDKILKVEAKRADEANYQREIARKKVTALYVISGIYIIGILVLGVYIYIKYDKERKSSFQNEYFREFIEDYDVTVIEYLFDRHITEKAFSTSILNMIYKKNIKFEEIDKNDYIFTKVSEEGLNESEKIVMNIIFDDAGDGNTTTLKKIKNYASKVVGTSSPFLNKYNRWKNKVTNESVKEDFYESLTFIKFIGIIYSIIGFFLVFFYISLEIFNILTLSIFILSFAFLLYNILFTKKTIKGCEHYAKWSAFKRFLLDFGRFDEKELPEIVLWERYLVYANIFGIADKVSKTMKIKFNEMSNYDNRDFMFDYVMWSHLNRSINNTVNSSISTANINVAKVASSSSSSGGGFGGGFSSGGGFGGGGGGGRGF